MVQPEVIRARHTRLVNQQGGQAQGGCACGGLAVGVLGKDLFEERRAIFGIDFDNHGGAGINGRGGDKVRFSRLHCHLHPIFVGQVAEIMRLTAGVHTRRARSIIARFPFPRVRLVARFQKSGGDIRAVVVRLQVPGLIHRPHPEPVQRPQLPNHPHLPGRRNDIHLVIRPRPVVDLPLNIKFPDRGDIIGTAPFDQHRGGVQNRREGDHRRLRGNAVEGEIPRGAHRDIPRAIHRPREQGHAQLIREGGRVPTTGQTPSVGPIRVGPQQRPTRVGPVTRMEVEIHSLETRAHVRGIYRDRDHRVGLNEEVCGQRPCGGQVAEGGRVGVEGQRHRIKVVRIARTGVVPRTEFEEIGAIPGQGKVKERVGEGEGDFVIVFGDD